MLLFALHAQKKPGARGARLWTCLLCCADYGRQFVCSQGAQWLRFISADFT